MNYNSVDVACLIHSTGYDWIYVERLHSMLSKHIGTNFKLHVYTEKDREVPAHMIKHVLEEWPGMAGPKKSWWHKLELFNPAHHRGPLLYLDLDTVIVNNLDWVFDCDPRYFWAIRDFRYLFKPMSQGINSSVMWWNTGEYEWVWNAFQLNKSKIMQGAYHGDQDFITEVIDHRKRRFFDQDRAVSWRWQALDGGYDFKFRKHKLPGTGTAIHPDNSLLIFHGNPKPKDVKDRIIEKHWQ